MSSIKYSIPKGYKNQKPKQVFAFNGFQGIDKENKPLRVQPFRATDGHNFIIDSGTLKTRPSYEMKINPSFDLEAGDYIIDWHLFGDTRVYVTRYHFYFETNGSSFNETNASLVKSGIATSFDFEGQKPHFQEEKECLFIFCLGNIYVFSKIFDGETLDKYVFYELRSRPSNPYSKTQLELYETFEDLPTPYEPTLYIDDKPFDDVNLLSNVSKYQLFASSLATENQETVYTLPTHYDEDKHGSFDVSQNIQVTFYKDRYGETPSVLPFFMGIPKENFDEDTFADYGTNFQALTELNGDNSLTIPEDVPFFADIRDTYFPQAEFVYFGHPDTPGDVISEPYGLTKEKFFKMIVKNTEGLTVFEYLMNYISTNQTTFSNMAVNKYIAFKLHVRYNATYRQNNTDYVVGKVVEEKDVKVFVQFRKFDSGILVLSGKSSLPVSIISSSTYPNYSLPAGYTEGDIDSTFYVNSNGLNAPDTDSVGVSVPESFSQQAVLEKFLLDAEAVTLEQQANITDQDVVRVRGKYYQTITVEEKTTSVTLPIVNSSDFKVNTNPLSSTISYPSYPNVSTADVTPTTLSLGNIGTGSSFSFNSGTSEYNALFDAIYNNINSTYTEDGTEVFQVRMYKTVTLPDPENGNPTTYYYTAAVKVAANYTIVFADVVTQRRYSITLVGVAEKGVVEIEKTLYRLSFKPEDGEIKLIVRDYFFDFNNEPTIDVKVTFNRNDDYDIISKSKFGITFGSENRLFLAGNPEYPNIDRFNVSNDLLGDGVSSQSYELSYFPSKNYRVIGGKGAINGYVIATDTELYVTKTEYPNDDRLFIRQRSLDANGIVGYNEFKTSIKQTPLNNRCVVRFYNDILVLSKDGLYGIEISSNVLTNERLVKLRSGFINEDLKSKIAALNDLSKVFIVENNRMMYIFLENNIFVLDSRYIAQNPNSEIENLSYEIVPWTTEVKWFGGKVYENQFYLLEENGKVIYGLGNNNYDEYVKKEVDFITDSDLTNYTGTKVFTIPSGSNFVFSDPSNYAFVFYSGYKVVGENPTDFTESSGTVTVVDVNDFAGVRDGDKLYWRTTSADPFTVTEFTVAGFEASNRTTFTYGGTGGERAKIYESIADVKLYITHYWQHNSVYYFSLSPYKPTTVTLITQDVGESDNDFFTRIYGVIGSLNQNYYFTTSGAKDLLLEHIPLINTRWVSAITDFGNNLFEKTSFRVNVYATKQESTNNMTFGYRTLRRLAGLSSPIDLSNEFNLEEVDYNQFTLATIDTVGFSLPMKENNFLYMQTTINGYGKIELNSIQITYKLNRILKSVG